jgi:hypothetical protein
MYIVLWPIHLKYSKSEQIYSPPSHRVCDFQQLSEAKRGCVLFWDF